MIKPFLWKKPLTGALVLVEVDGDQEREIPLPAKGHTLDQTLEINKLARWLKWGQRTPWFDSPGWDDLHRDDSHQLAHIGLAKKFTCWADFRTYSWQRLAHYGLVKEVRRGELNITWRLTPAGRDLLLSLSEADARWMFPIAADIAEIQRRLREQAALFDGDAS